MLLELYLEAVQAGSTRTRGELLPDAHASSE